MLRPGARLLFNHGWFPSTIRLIPAWYMRATFDQIVAIKTHKKTPDMHWLGGGATISSKLSVPFMDQAKRKWGGGLNGSTDSLIYQCQLSSQGEEGLNH